LQAPISNNESIQPIVIVKGSTVVAINLVINVPNGGEDDGVESVKEYAITSSNDS